MSVTDLLNAVSNSVAGTNEKKFIKLIGSDIIRDKIIFGCTLPGHTNISVDGHFVYNNKLYIIEVDSSNEAKLLVGQYCLIDALFSDSNNLITKDYINKKKDVVFLVIHYYKKYNVERTAKNLLTVKLKYGIDLEYRVIHSKNFTDWNTFKVLL